MIGEPTSRTGDCAQPGDLVDVPPASAEYLVTQKKAEHVQRG